MRKNIDKLIQDLQEDNEGLDVIQNNLKNLDYVLNKIVYLKSHAVNMMFKDAIILKKEPLDEKTVNKGIAAFQQLMEKALSKIVNEGSSQGETNMQTIINKIVAKDQLL